MKMYVIIITDFFTECKYFSLHFPINMCYIVAMRTSKKKSKKRPSEKLMEASKKKYSKKKIDDNILRRAMEKPENEEE